MKKTILILALCLSFCKISAQDNQDSKWNIEIHHPLSVGDNFVKEAFNGVVGIDIRYKIISIPLVDFKLGIIADYFNYNFIESFNGSSFIIKPKAIGEFNLNSKFTPYVSVGYSIMTSKIKTDTILDIVISDDPSFGGQSDSFTDNGYGFNFGFGLKYNITETFFAQTAIDFFSLEPQDDVQNISYNKNIQTIYIGVGINL